MLARTEEFGRMTILQKFKTLFGPEPADNVKSDEINLIAATPLPEAIRFPRPSETPEISIVILSYGQVDFTLRCLHSIAQNAPTCSMEVIVSDDQSGDPDVQKLARVQNLTLWQPEQNLGFLRHANWAVARSRGKYILLLNNDVQLLSGAIDALLAVAQRPGVGMVGPKFLCPDGRLLEAGGIVWNDASAWNFGRGDDPTAPQYNYTRDTDYISGAALLFSRDLWAKLNGFDVRFAPAYYEDTDFAFRVRQFGLRTIYVPAARVVHHEGISHGTDPTSGVKAHQATNRQRFLARWSSELTSSHYSNGSHVLRARDRAAHKKIMLMMDHYVPQPDRDAGSRSMIELIKTLQIRSWGIKFWPHNLHFDPRYTPPLQDTGVEVLYRLKDWRFKNWFSQYFDQIDLVFLSRPTLALPYLKAVRALAPKTPIIFYGHDLHFARMRQHAAILHSSEFKETSVRMERLERKIWVEADLTLYLSEEEVCVAKALEPTASVMATPGYCFDDLVSPRSAPANRDIMFVAGFAHPPNIDAACWLVGTILPLVRQKIPDVRLWIVGTNPSDKVKALASENVFVTGHVSEEALNEKYLQVRAAVVPLRFGAGVKLKVVEALHYGTPLVTTPIGAAGIRGLDEVAAVDDDPKMIATSVVRLLTSDEAWHAQSEKQLEYSRKVFSREVFMRSLDKAIEVAETRASARLSKSSSSPRKQIGFPIRARVAKVG
jgi:O-antigen biosynthesis protein